MTHNIMTEGRVIVSKRAFNLIYSWLCKTT